MTDGYEVFGLRVRSAIALPELHPASGEGAADVEIRLAAIPPEKGEKAGLTVGTGGALLNIPEVGRYLMRGGRELLVEPAPAVSDRNLRLFLLGSAFAAILHQRGLLPLHANAVEIDGRAVAFMGHSGAGKSTIAAWYHDRGFRVLADDVCVVKDVAGRPLAHGGIPRLRLSREALEASGRTAQDYEPSFDDMDKFNVPTAPAPAEPIALGHVYLLGKAPDAAKRADIRRLLGVEAVDALVANTYRGAYLPLMGGTKRHLMACVALAGKVPVFSAGRLWGYQAFEEQAGAIEAHARSIIASAITPERV